MDNNDKENRQIILGGGLSGLIWAVYHPDSVIIEPGELGGMVHNNMGPMMLHATEEVKDFIRKIGLESKTKTARVGYTRQLGTVFDRPPDKQFREDYYRHSRLLTQDHKIPESVMSSDSSVFVVIDIPIKEIVRHTIDYIESQGVIVLKKKVNKISHLKDNVNRLILEDFPRIYSDNIVSTIPITIFQKLVDAYQVKHTDRLIKVFVDTGNTEEVEDKFFNSFDYIYVVSTYNGRLTRIILTDRVVYEYTLNVDENPIEIVNMWPTMKTSTIRDVIRISKNLKHWNNIKFLGRTAQWDHSIKLNDVIKEAQEDVE